MCKRLGQALGILAVLAVIGGIIACVVMGGLDRIAQLSAREAYDASAEILKSQGREAVLIRIDAGQIPLSTIRGTTPLRVKGRGARWDLCFHSPDGEEYMIFGPSYGSSAETAVEEQDNYRCGGDAAGAIDISRWHVDSEEAIQIARDQAVALDREKHVEVRIVLEQGSEGPPTWRIEFLPPKLTYGGVGLSLLIDAETGAVLEIEYPPRSYE